MLLCNYINDLGVAYYNVTPIVQGIDKATGEGLSVGVVFTDLAQYIDSSLYFEGNVQTSCGVRGRKRRIRLERGARRYELEYPRPFVAIDWQRLETDGVACEVIPEFINDNNLNLILLRL